MDSLHVSETFYSIQGEGQTTGTPAVFLRLSGCNLLCEWCDTTEVWQKGVKTPFDKVLTPEYIKRLKEGAHLVITGGEPLLHQKKLYAYLNWLFKTYEFNPTLEIETNGTIVPDRQLFFFIKYWNVSPKLSNAKEPLESRFNLLALSKIETEAKQVIFKFVIYNDTDYLEILQDYSPYINMKRVWLMPCGESQDQLRKSRGYVAELALKQGHYYCDRLHVVIWNQKTGV